MANYCVYSGGNGTSGAVAGTTPTSGEWATAHQSLSACLTAITEATNDIIFIASDHVANYGVSTTLTLTAFVNVLSINRTSGVLEAGATENTNSNSSITLNGVGAYVNGLTMRPGTGTSQSSAFITLNNSTTLGNFVFESCTFYLNTVHIAPTVTVGVSDITDQHKTIFKNCAFRFGNASQKLICGGTQLVEFYQCSISALSTVPTVFLDVDISRGAVNIKASSCDFSNCSALVLMSDPCPSVVSLTNCKTPATLTSGSSTLGGTVLECFACSSSDSILGYYFEDGSGKVSNNTGVYLTSGSATFKEQNGTATSESLMLVSSANASTTFPLCTPWIYSEITSTGSKTFSVKVAHTEASVLKDNEIWLEVELMGDANTPQTTYYASYPKISGTQSLDFLSAGNNLTDTSEAWTGITSEKSHTLSITATANQQGFARARVCLAKPSITAYVNPAVVVA